MSGSQYRERLERREGRDGPGGAWCIVERAVPPIFAPIGTTRVASEDPAVRWLLDRAEIHDLLTRYAVGVDARNYAPVRACFARTFHANYLGHELTDIDALEQFVRGVEHFGWTRHFLGRPVLDLAGDAASSDVTAILSSRTADDPKGRRERMTAARYRDELVRERGRWRVASRRHGVESPPLDPTGARPRSTDPAIAYLIDRAEIEDCVVAFARSVDRKEGTVHFVGNQRVRIEDTVAAVETYVYRLEPVVGARDHTPWHERPQRFEDRLVREDGRWRVASHRVCSNRVAESRRESARAPDR
jgi:hypothetical protein